MTQAISGLVDAICRGGSEEESQDVATSANGGWLKFWREGKGQKVGNHSGLSNSISKSQILDFKS